MVFSTLRITAFNSHIPQVCSCFADYASLENPHLKSKIWFLINLFRTLLKIFSNNSRGIADKLGTHTSSMLLLCRLCKP